MIRAMGRAWRIHASAASRAHGDVFGVGARRYADLRGDEQIIGAEVHSAQVDDLLDARGPHNRRVDLVDLFGDSGLTDEHAGDLPGTRCRHRSRCRSARSAPAGARASTWSRSRRDGKYRSGLSQRPVFEVEAAQKRLPPAIDIGGGGAGDRGPEPDGRRPSMLALPGGW